MHLSALDIGILVYRRYVLDFEKSLKKPAMLFSWRQFDCEFQTGINVVLFKKRIMLHYVFFTVACIEEFQDCLNCYPPASDGAFENKTGGGDYRKKGGTKDLKPLP